MKYFCLRFDVDTPKCIKQGVPNLIRLSKKLDVPFTFFINMGRGTSRWSFIKKRLPFRSKSITQTTKKLSDLKKLGLWDYFLMALINPKVGNSHPEIIKSLKKAGHEVGLHGGSNHGEWQNESHKWRKQKFIKEINPALDSLAKFLGEKPLGFSSPGWCGSNDLNTILESLNFHYVADAYGENLKEIDSVGHESKLLQVPTNILGDGGVAYIENLRAKNMDDNAILEDFSSKLDKKFFKEINPALDSLAKFLGEKPLGFSSPGWCGSNDLNTILESLNFHYVADAYGENLKKIVSVRHESKLLQVPTNILGDGGVAYIENLRAKNMDDKAILQDFSSKLDKKYFAVLYDHPYYAGIQELSMLEMMIELAKSKGFQIVTLKTLVEKRNFQEPHEDSFS